MLDTVTIETDDLGRLEFAIPRDVFAEHQFKLGSYVFVGGDYFLQIESLPWQQDFACFTDAIAWAKSVPSERQIDAFARDFACSVVEGWEDYATLRIYGGDSAVKQPGPFTYGDLVNLLNAFMSYRRTDKNRYYEAVYVVGTITSAAAFELVGGTFSYVTASLAAHGTIQDLNASGQTNTSISVAS